MAAIAIDPSAIVIPLSKHICHSRAPELRQSAEADHARTPEPRQSAQADHARTPEPRQSAEADEHLHKPIKQQKTTSHLVILSRFIFCIVLNCIVLNNI